MKLAALHAAFSCECCVQELDILHDVLVTSDISVAKALMISEVAQIARLEMRMRDYLTGKWRTRAKQASEKAGAVVSRGGTLKAACAVVDQVMDQWADEVESRVTTDLESIYKLARKAGWKKASGKTSASLQYVVPNFTEELEAGREKVQKAGPKGGRVAEVSPKFDVLDEGAVKDLQADQMMWIGRHYQQNLRAAVRGAVEPGMREGVGHNVAGKRVAAAVEKELGRVVVPKGFRGSDAKYFEGIAANTSTNARVRGQIRSFSDIGITKYEIVNPMDTRTTQICAFMNGQTFTVKDANAQIERTSAATNPGQVKAAHPWLSVGKIKSAFRKGGARGLSEAGLALPPYHFRCRSTVDVSVESMSFDDLDRSETLEPTKPTSTAAPEPVAPAPVAPSVPSTRVGEHAEKLFGKKLTDAEIDALSGRNAKLPTGHIVKVSVTDYATGKGQPRMMIEGVIGDKKGEVVGKFQRIYMPVDGKVEVNHASFFLDAKLQNSGIGREVFNTQIDAYQKLGIIAKVNLDAAEVGKYVWTKAGFEWTDPAQLKVALEKLEAKVKRKVGATVAKKLMSQVKTPEDISRLVIDGERVGKDFLVDKSKKAFGHDLIEMSQTPAKIKRL